MKQDNTTVNVVKTEEFEEVSFGIKSKEHLVHIFELLRNKIYTDKILACIREYSTNAQDAHIENGTPERQIKVTLPSRISTEFKVRDYGKGLSFEDIAEIYTQYGASTKRDSNSFNGQLGLGCKAAFAYGEAFSITSWHDGKKTVYTAYIDETKLGKVAKMFEEDSDEESGIEISIQVLPQDVESFNHTAKKFYSTFSPWPEINMDQAIFEADMQGEGWVLYKRSGKWATKPNSHYPPSFHDHIDSNTCVMGNVAYPIRITALRNAAPSSYHNLINQFSNSPFVFNFEIGDIQIASSREDLEYKEKTVKAILSRMESVQKSLESELQSKIASAENIYQAKTIWAQIFGYAGQYANITQFTSIRSLEWNDTTISNNDFHITVDNKYKTNRYHRGNSSDPVWSVLKIYRNTWGNRSMKTSKVTWTSASITDDECPVHLFFKDTTKKWRRRLEKFIDEQDDNKDVYLIDYEPNDPKWVKEYEYWKEVNHITDDINPIRMLSEIEPPAIVRGSKEDAERVRSEHAKKNVFQLVDNNPHAKAESKYWVISDDELDSEGYYVEIFRFKPVNCGGCDTSADLFTWLEDFESFSGLDLKEDMYGLKTKVLEKGKENKTSLVDKIKEECLKIARGQDIKDYVSTFGLKKWLSDNGRNMEGWPAYRVSELFKAEDFPNSSDEMKAFLLPGDDALETKINNLHKFARKFGFLDELKAVAGTNANLDYSHLAKKLSEDYPALHVLTRYDAWRWTQLKIDQKETIRDYINLIDSNKEKESNAKTNNANQG